MSRLDLTPVTSGQVARHQAMLNQLADLVWEDWNTDLPSVHRTMAKEFGPEYSARVIQDAYLTKYAPVTSSKQVRSKREADAVGRRAAELRTAVGGRPKARPIGVVKGAPLQSRITVAAKKIARAIVGLPPAGPVNAKRKLDKSKVASRTVSHEHSPSERVRAAQPNCKERPEPGLPKAGRGGRKKTEYIPWCDEVRRRR